MPIASVLENLPDTFLPQTSLYGTKAQIMNAKKSLIAAIVLSTVLLTVAASFCEHLTRPTQRNCTALTGPAGKFGPVIEAIVPAAKSKGVEILDLETGHALLQPSPEYFDSRPDTITAWIRFNRLDISCFVWSCGAACVTYDMTIVPVERKCWEQTSEEALRDNPALAPVPHSPRRLLVLGKDQPDTYIFRTGDGTLGMLRLVDLKVEGRGVKIRYKLINPARSFAAM
jgi:hypothetical protein